MRVSTPTPLEAPAPAPVSLQATFPPYEKAKLDIRERITIKKAHRCDSNQRAVDSSGGFRSTLRQTVNSNDDGEGDLHEAKRDSSCRSSAIFTVISKINAVSSTFGTDVKHCFRWMAFFLTTITATLCISFAAVFTKNCNWLDG